jgi:hypothetical protein
MCVCVCLLNKSPVIQSLPTHVEYIQATGAKYRGRAVARLDDAVLPSSALDGMRICKHILIIPNPIAFVYPLPGRCMQEPSVAGISHGIRLNVKLSRLH